MGRSQTGRPCGPRLWSPNHATRRLHRVLAALSLKPLRALLSPSSGYVTHALLTLSPLTAILLLRSVRLACLSHAASVRSEPGSNSSRKSGNTARRPRCFRFVPGPVAAGDELQGPDLPTHRGDQSGGSVFRRRTPFPQGGRAGTLLRLHPLFTCHRTSPGIVSGAPYTSIARPECKGYETRFFRRA